MKRSVIVVLVLLVAALGMPATAWAGRAPAPLPAITAVTPSSTYVTASDSYGAFRVYDADVTLTWNGTTRVMVYLLLPDGTRRPPGELVLGGTETRTVTVPGVIVPQGTRGVFEAYALKWASPKSGWKVVSYLKSGQIVEFPAS